jgi:hypothetical protein
MDKIINLYRSFNTKGSKMNNWYKTSKKDPFWDEGISVKKNFKKEDANKKELEMGMMVEMEHTSDKKMAEKIALDHLAEDAKYYSKLKTLKL